MQTISSYDLDLIPDMDGVYVNGNVHLRNEFNFWKVHGIMNTSGLVQSK